MLELAARQVCTLAKLTNGEGMNDPSRKIAMRGKREENLLTKIGGAENPPYGTEHDASWSTLLKTKQVARALGGATWTDKPSVIDGAARCNDLLLGGAGDLVNCNVQLNRNVADPENLDLLVLTNGTFGYKIADGNLSTGRVELSKASRGSPPGTRRGTGS